MFRFLCVLLRDFHLRRRVCINQSLVRKILSFRGQAAFSEVAMPSEYKNVSQQNDIPPGCRGHLGWLSGQRWLCHIR